MKLTEQQKTEISNYIAEAPRYRETYMELYDHIIAVFEEEERSYSLKEVSEIIYTDFGGFSEIVNKEKEYQKQLSKKYKRFFIQEMLNMFKLPKGIINILFLVLCYWMGTEGSTASFNPKTMMISAFIIGLFTYFFGYAVTYYKKRKYRKSSILDDFIKWESSFWIWILYLCTYFFIAKDPIFEVFVRVKMIIVWALFLGTSLYIRTYMKFYKNRLHNILV